MRNLLLIGCCCVAYSICTSPAPIDGANVVGAEWQSNGNTCKDGAEETRDCNLGQNLPNCTGTLVASKGFATGYTIWVDPANKRCTNATCPLSNVNDQKSVACVID